MFGCVPRVLPSAPAWTIDWVFHLEIGTILHRRVLAWVDRLAREILDAPNSHSSLLVMVFASRMERICDFDEAGLACRANVGEDAWPKVLMHRFAQNPVVDYALPAGLIMRPLASEKDIKAYVKLHRTVVESRNMIMALPNTTCSRWEIRSRRAWALFGRLSSRCARRLCPAWLVNFALGPHTGALRAFTAAHPEIKITTGHMWLDFFEGSGCPGCGRSLQRDSGEDG